MDEEYIPINARWTVWLPEGSPSSFCDEVRDEIYNLARAKGWDLDIDWNSD